MASALKRKSHYKSDDFVVSDDEDARPGKKGKTTNEPFKPSTTAQVDDEGNRYWELSKARRVTVSEFKRKQMVNIREYYSSDGKWLPGKKGISMTIEQYSALINVMPQIEQLLRSKGEDVPRPSYDGKPAVKEEEEDEDDSDGDEDQPQNGLPQPTDDEDE